MIRTSIRWLCRRIVALCSVLRSRKVLRTGRSTPAEMPWLWLQTPGVAVGRPGIF